MDAFLQDVAYAARLWRRNPPFALTAALSLAIGIGATTTIFTIANALLFRAPAGVAESDRLVDIVPTEEGRFGISLSSYLDYLEIRSRATLLDGAYAYQLEIEPMSLRREESPSAERVFGNFVTANYFDVLGVTAAAGRLFAATDIEQPGANPIVVLSYRYWTRRFNKDSIVVGETLRLNGAAFTVAGVAREGFQGSSVVAPDVWLPVPTVTALETGTSRLKTREVWLMLPPDCR